jgi:hypothetical protein
MNIFNFIKKNNITNLVVHGLLNNTHSHYHIHKAIYLAFNYISDKIKEIENIKINTYWINDSDCKDTTEIYNKINEKYLVFSSPHYNTDIFLPIQENIYYILHFRERNVFNKELITKYDTLLLNKKAVKYIEFRQFVQNTSNITLLDEQKTGTQYHNTDDNSCTIPWATNLLPNEIDENIKKIESSSITNPFFKKENGFVFCGSVWSVNIDVMEKAKEACDLLNINYNKINIDDEKEHNKIIHESYIAPAIQGDEHFKYGGFYIPCRFFKNISFGTLPITNNKGLYELFSNFLVFYDDDIELLIKKSTNFLDECLLNSDKYEKYKTDLISIMINIKENHTYINRLNHLINYLNN